MSILTDKTFYCIIVFDFNFNSIRRYNVQTAINFLKALSEIRSPFLDALVQLVTRLGEEVIILGVICFFYWCLNKNTAYKIGLIFFTSGMLVQGLKISFRIDRPFVIDKTFKPVESAVEGATGYSFPSGHTQSATSLYGYFALAVKKPWLKALFVLAFLLVGFSRLYLGVHTYFDVGVSLILTLAVVFLVSYIFDKLTSGKYDLVLSAILAAASIFLCVYAFILAKVGYADTAQINDCFKSGGAGVAFALGFFLERKYIKFDVSAKKTYVQIIKFVLGVAGALILKSGLKLIAPGNLILDFIRYFLTVLWVLVIYPYLFTKVLSGGKKEALES